MVLAQYKEKFTNLSEQEALRVFEVVSLKINEKGQFKNQPDGIEGLKLLVQCKPELQNRFASFIASIPKKEVGFWVLKGFDKAIPNNTDAWKMLEKYHNDLRSEGNEEVKKALNALGEKK